MYVCSSRQQKMYPRPPKDRRKLFGSIISIVLLYWLISRIIQASLTIDTPTCKNINQQAGARSTWVTRCYPKPFKLNHPQTSSKTDRPLAATILSILLSGDVECNPGPTKDKCPCGLCHRYVESWRDCGIKCDGCDIWYHQSCTSLCSAEFAYLDNNSKTFRCFKCHCNITVNSRYQEYELETSNRYSTLSSLNDSVFSSPGGPIYQSSPLNTDVTSRAYSIRTGSNTQSTRSTVSSSSSGSSNANLSKFTSKKGNLRSIVVNANGINTKGKPEQLRHLISYTDPDIIFVTETKVVDEVGTAEFLPPELGYQVFRNDRTAHGGGVLIAVKQDPNHPCEVISQDDDVEDILWVKITLAKAKTVFAGCFYRQPNHKVEQLNNLDTSLKKIRSIAGKNPNATILVAGDFNARGIDWENLTSKPGSTQKAVENRLLEILTDHELHQHQREPTRLNEILDLFCSNKPGLIKSTSTIPGISDHDIPVIDSLLFARPNTQTPRKIHKFSKADWSTLKEDFTSFRSVFNEEWHSRGVDENWNIFKRKLLELMDKHIPTAMTKKHQSVPWWNKKLQRLVRSKQRSYNKAKKSKKKQNWAKYRIKQKVVQREMRKAHWSYVNNVLTSGPVEESSKRFWKYVKNKKQDNIGVAPLKKDGVLYRENREKAEILNHQFQSVFTPDTAGPLPEYTGKAYPDIPDIIIQPEGVAKLLHHIKPHKASGPDGLPCRILKELADEIAPVLTIIFNQSLQLGQTPKDWNTANVAPIFKKGDTNIPANYRPVSLTCVCCKILEHVIVRQIVHHYERHNILTNHQHGFRAKHSCVSQLITTVHDLLTNHDESVQTDIIVLDFSKAFDKVPHRRLLHKLENYGVRGTTLRWISSFLSGRSQRVVVDGAESQWGSVDSGVPQGSVLGPLLFLTHINDLPEVVQSNCRLFADDCLLYRAIKSREDQLKLQQDLDRLQAWAREWGMQFNASKCEVLRSSTSRTPKQCFYTIDNQVLSEVENAKYLGVYLSNDMSWKTHIEYTINKANRTLGFLRRNLYGCPKDLREQAYLSLVRSVLEYAAQVWDPHNKTVIRSIEAVQNRGARFVKRNHSTYASVSQMIKDLQWESLETRRKHLRLVLMYQGLNNLVAIPTSPIKPASRAASRKQFKVIGTIKDPLKHSFYPSTIKEWNKLPAEVTGSSSVDIFRANLLATAGRE